MIMIPSNNYVLGQRMTHLDRISFSAGLPQIPSPLLLSCLPPPPLFSKVATTYRTYPHQRVAVASAQSKHRMSAIRSYV